MAGNIKNGKLFYHITAIENLKSIFKNGLLSRNYAISRGFLKKDVADSEIIEKRKSLGIDDFVPFHFFEKTPFTGAVMIANTNIDFCVITIKREFARNNKFKICTAHPLSSNVRIFDYNEGLNSIDWKKMEERNFSDEESKNVCMAECLATSPVLPKNFHSIYVPNEKIRALVEKLAKEVLKDYKFHININASIAGKIEND